MTFRKIIREVFDKMEYLVDTGVMSPELEDDVADLLIEIEDKLGAWLMLDE